MILTFENQTHELTEYEYKVIMPILIDGLKRKVGKSKAVTNGKICSSLKAKGYKVSEPRIRKIIYFIRQNNAVPMLIASSKGYWVTNDVDEINDWLQSLKSRIEAMQETKNYAEEMLDTINKI